MPAALGWTVLALVFVDEVLAVWALAHVGGHLGGWPVGLLLAVCAVAVWWMFASPKALWGSPIVRPVVKVVVFGSAVVGLVWTGHQTAGVALLVFSVVVNALAMLPSVAQLAESASDPGRP